MSDSERAALLFSQTACALITAMGMLVQDLHRIHHFAGAGIHTEEAYQQVILDNGIHWNAAVGLLRE